VKAKILWRVVRAEGMAAAVDRLRARLAESRRRRSFRPAAAPPPGFTSAILNLAAAAPAPRLGGVQAQLLWRLEAEAARRPVALLYPEDRAGGRGYRLELQSGHERRALYLPSAPRAAAAEPQAGTALADPELERAVAWAAAHCGATLLQVEGLAGMPLGSLQRLRQAGLRLVLAVHDFAAFCPRPHLLESLPPPAPPHFCHYSRDALRCARCLGRDVAGLAPGYQALRRELARRLLASADAVVYPSTFLARTHDELFGGAGSAAGRVIAPAGSPALLRSRPASHSAGPPPSPRWPQPPRHIAWVGAVQVHKGALVFEAAVQRLTAAGRRLRLTVYGGGDAAILTRWRRLPGLRVRGYYRAGSLPALLRRDGVDLALLLSIVPESYGLTLDECAAAAVPVVAFDHGALAERIAAERSGLLLAASLADDPAAAGAALAALLADLLDGRLEVPPPPIPPPPSASPHLPAAVTAAGAWIELYRALGELGPQSST
jgi:glycosyltransferase involved in cell wall biosynthesis